VNIGIISPFQRGGYGYTVLDIRKQLIKYGHSVSVLARNNTTRELEFNVPNVEWYPGREIPVDVINYWIKKNGISRCIFLGFDSADDLIKIIGSISVTVETISIPMWECIKDITLYKDFDRVICPTKKCFSFFKDFDQAVYVKWGFDDEIFKPSQDLLLDTKPIKYFHPVGKDTQEDLSGKVPTLRGFLNKNRIGVTDQGELAPRALLYVHSLLSNNQQPVNYNLGHVIIGKQNLSRSEILTLYQCSDCCVLPSKVEGLGLSFLEAIGCSLPVITVDEAPMNEFVINEKTGYTLDRDRLEHGLAWAFNWFEDSPETILEMKKNTLKMRSEWSWKTNGEALVTAIVGE